MKIGSIPFTVTDWNRVNPVEYKGENGTSFWKTYQDGDIRVRLVEYSPGFRSDHFCGRGHVLLVMEGELTIRLRDGQNFRIESGSSFQVGDDDSNPHLAYTEKGARVFIVD